MFIEVCMKRVYVLMVVDRDRHLKECVCGSQWCGWW